MKIWLYISYIFWERNVLILLNFIEIRCWPDCLFTNFTWEKCVWKNTSSKVTSYALKCFQPCFPKHSLPSCIILHSILPSGKPSTSCSCQGRSNMALELGTCQVNSGSFRLCQLLALIKLHCTCIASQLPHISVSPTKFKVPWGQDYIFFFF